MPDRPEIVSENGSTVTMRVTLPSDDAGHFGRQCPSCKRIFRMHAEDYQAPPEDPRLTCPYCCVDEPPVPMPSWHNFARPARWTGQAPRSAWVRRYRCPQNAMSSAFR
jgi:hypothetical protein